MKDEFEEKDLEETYTDEETREREERRKRKDGNEW